MGLYLSISLPGKAERGLKDQRLQPVRVGRKGKKQPQSGLWYKKGLRFECTQCGACCTGNPGTVQFTGEEGTAMARTLGLEAEEFLARYATPSEPQGTWRLQELHTEHGFDCVLLDRCPDTGKTWCTAHDARPTQCRTWPFWPGNLRNPKAWERAARGCEGIGRGNFVPLPVIQEQLNQTPPWGVL